MVVPANADSLDDEAYGSIRERMPELLPIAPELWTVTRPLRFLGVETGCRMTIVRLRDGGLFIHSPVALEPALATELETLGPVRAVAAPSLFHHLRVAEWKQAYPAAIFACCPGLERKRADFAWDRVLGDQPEPEWAGDPAGAWARDRARR